MGDSGLGWAAQAAVGWAPQAAVGLVASARRLAQAAAGLAALVGRGSAVWAVALNAALEVGCVAEVETCFASLEAAA